MAILVAFSIKSIDVYAIIIIIHSMRLFTSTQSDAAWLFFLRFSLLPLLPSNNHTRMLNIKCLWTNYILSLFYLFLAFTCALSPTLCIFIIIIHRIKLRIEIHFKWIDYIYARLKCKREKKHTHTPSNREKKRQQ